MCQYHKKCNYFDKTAVCCNDDNEANGYCGAWINFHNKEKEQK